MVKKNKCKFDTIIFTNLETFISNLLLSINTIDYADKTIYYLKYWHGVIIINSKYKIFN